ncbi:MAG: hypothetical protein WC332_00365 [Clostridia bacterium]|jgi:hypothetical protein
MTQNRRKLNTANSRKKSDYNLQIDEVINQAEQNEPDNYWDYCTDSTDDLNYLKRKIEKQGSVEIEI